MKIIRTSVVGEFELRLAEKAGAYQGAVIAKAGGRVALLDGIDPDEVWHRLQDEAGKAGRSYAGFSGASARFRRFFPEGLNDPGYAVQERDYKCKAKKGLDAALPLAEAAAGHNGCGKAALSAFHAMNLLGPFEKAKLAPLLRGPSADAFIHAAARFAMGEEPALLELDRILRPHDSARWTVATYLPFLWRPDVHMFLKPEVTREFAARVGHPFVHEYLPQLSMDVYASLLRLVEKTEREMADVGLAPRDRIDVQSFIWVVGSYSKLETE